MIPFTLDVPLPTDPVRCPASKWTPGSLRCDVCEDSAEKFYRCARCGRQVPTCFGATDGSGSAVDMWCDDCWASTQP